VPKVPPYPEEFRRRAVELVRTSGDPLSKVARDLGVSETGLRNWLVQAEIDAGERQGLSSDERRELAELRRQNRRLAMENEILKRAAAYFAQENVLPK
jgi:transposase-like protein